MMTIHQVWSNTGTEFREQNLRNGFFMIAIHIFAYAATLRVLTQLLCGGAGI